jgi:hypothetical protein
VVAAAVVANAEEQNRQKRKKNSRHMLDRSFVGVCHAAACKLSSVRAREAGVFGSICAIAARRAAAHACSYLSQAVNKVA